MAVDGHYNPHLVWYGAWLVDCGGFYHLANAQEHAEQHDATVADIVDGRIPIPDCNTPRLIFERLSEREAALVAAAFLLGTERRD